LVTENLDRSVERLPRGIGQIGPELHDIIDLLIMGRFFLRKWTAAVDRGKDGFKKMAGAAGLEPVTSAVTGQRSNQLSYAPAWELSN
jgi:hypothetical protein